MKCPKCQHFNDVAAKFCAECASPLARTCASCGHPLPQMAKFCPECAHPTALVTTSQSPFGPPETYTPKHLVAKILNSKAAIEGERKQVTVLFADLKGSLELLADRDPEEARKLLDPVLELMMEAVHHYEGTVSQAAGDGIMALFGAPLAHEDHAVRACYAALRMQERAKRHAESVLRTHGVALKIRVGLNSGDVVVRAINSDLHMDYSAIGRTTHLAARMEQLADPGSILMTPSTLELVDGFVTAKSLGPIPVKGLVTSLEVHEVTGVGPVRTRFQSGARRGLTPFVGRERELEQLRQAQRLAGNGQGQVMALVAEAGVGKSRLVFELAHSPAVEDWLVMECAAASYGKAMSYLPVVNLLKGYFAINEQDSLQTIGDKVKTRLLALDQALAPTLPALLALLDAPVNDSAWQGLDPTQRRRHMLDGVRYLLLREARQRPLLLIFEDLHWIDSETQAVLDSLVESLGTARILLLVTYRPEYQHGWAGKSYYSQLRLGSLAGESNGRLLDALLGDDPTLLSLKQLLANHGNPFFLEETVRTLVETKVLEGSSGGYRLTRPIEAIQVPATVQVVLASRIDRLSLENKRLLQIAAVIGRRVPCSLLRAVADVPDEALREGLDRLQSAEFVFETGLFPDLEYSFKHAITQDVAYGGILQDRRRELHAQIVSSIEALHHNRLGEQIELLAHHAAQGELREKAVDYLRRAGQKGATRSALSDARVWFEQALVVLEGLPETKSTLEASFEICLDLRIILSLLGEVRRGVERVREAEALAERLNDDHRRARVCATLVHFHWTLGELDEAFRTGIRALELVARLGDFKLRIQATSLLVQVHCSRAEYPRAIELATTNLTNLPAECVQEFFDLPMPASIYNRGWLVTAFTQLGRFAEAAQCGAEMLQLAESMPVPFTIGFTHQMIAWSHMLRGDWERARLHIEQAIAVFRARNVMLLLPGMIVSSARVLAELGEAREALIRLREGHELLERQAARERIMHLGPAYLALGRAGLVLGRLEDARRLVDRAVEFYGGQQGVMAHALYLRGDVATHADNFDAETGEAHYRQALALAESHGMRPLIAHCHFGLSMLYRRTGKHEQARERLATATSMYREMDMPFYLEQAEVQSSLVA
jgi:class 3 adenylate cyclase/tetratricopeptide (TPR) repeat protein